MNKNENSKLKKFFSIKNSLIYLGIFLLISAAALYYINYLYSEGNNLNLIFSFPSSILISLAALLFFYFLFDGLRLYLVLKTLNAQISFWEIYKLVFINIFISNITPLATGGGVAQAYFLQRSGIPLGKSSAAVVIRTLLSASMLFLSVPLILLNNKNMISLLPGNYIFVYIIIFILLYLLTFYLLIFKNRLIMKCIYKILYFLNSKHLLSKKRYRKILKYLFKHLKLFAEDLAFFIQGKKIYIIFSVFFTVLFLLAEFSFSYLLLIGLGYQISFIYILSLQILVVFIMYFSPTPGAAGIAEGGYSILFARFVAEKDIFPLIFYWRFFSKYIGIFFGVLIFFYMLIRGGVEVEE